MIAKVTRGDGPGEAVRYLFSAGRHNEHEDPHVVAAAAALGVSGGLRPSLAELKGLEAAMEAPSVLYGTEVAGGTCWHLALSTKGGVDRDLSDSEWAEMAREAVRPPRLRRRRWPIPLPLGGGPSRALRRPVTTTCTSS